MLRGNLTWRSSWFSDSINEYLLSPDFIADDIDTGPKLCERFDARVCVPERAYRILCIDLGLLQIDIRKALLASDLKREKQI